MEINQLNAALAGLLLNAKYFSPGVQIPKKYESLFTNQDFKNIIALAELLSVGDSNVEPPKSVPLQRLTSVFDNIAINRSSLSGRKHYLQLGSLCLEKNTIFPKEIWDDEIVEADLQALQKIFDQAVSEDQPDDLTYLENLLATLQKTTWCVPSPYHRAYPDVSLYDHNRMTSALAVCLAEKNTKDIVELLDAVEKGFKDKNDDPVPALEQPVALLIGGDLSGVQKFIYTLSSKGAAKTLRGRSFYLQLLTEAVLRYVLRALDIPTTNVIYSGGGHFYLLAPPGAKDRLIEIQKDITKILFDHHGVSLYLALDHAEVPASGFQKGNLPEYWTKMHSRLTLAKKHRYTELGDELFDTVFEPKKHGGNRENTCSVCGEEREKVEPLDDPQPDEALDAPTPKICSLCKSFEVEIGKQLPDAKFVGLGFGEPRENTQLGTAFDVLHTFGMEIDWADHADETITFSDKVERTVIWALDDTDKWPVVNDVPSANLTRYTVNQIPRMTFDQLQEEAKGIRRLGVLRMDVDDLGEIFQNGFGEKGESRSTLARLSTLSFQLSLFFEGWIKRLCEKYPNLIYAVYAGGDDVFLIGPWNLMPELAQSISTDLALYTGSNPDIHISGGMAFIHGKYPVYQAAEDAGDAEAAAKDVKGKNAFTFLEQVWQWKDFANVRKKHDLINEIVSEKKDGGLGGSQALIQTLRQLAIDEAEARKKAGGKVVYGRWMWQGVYLLKRMEERVEKKQPKVAEKIKEIRENLDNNNFSEIAQWGTAARWVQFEIRKQKEKEDQT